MTLGLGGYCSLQFLYATPSSRSQTTVRFPGYDYVLPAYDSADAILSVYFCVVDVFSTAKKENR